MYNIDVDAQNSQVSETKKNCNFKTASLGLLSMSVPLMFPYPKPLSGFLPFPLAKASADSTVFSSNFYLNSRVSDSPPLMISWRFIVLIS